MGKDQDEVDRLGCPDSGCSEFTRNRQDEKDNTCQRGSCSRNAEDHLRATSAGSYLSLQLVSHFSPLSPQSEAKCGDWVQGTLSILPIYTAYTAYTAYILYTAYCLHPGPRADCRPPTACRLPTPDSRLPTPDSRLPTPDPTPDSRLPTPDSRLPSPTVTVYWLCADKLTPELTTDY
jgi:hypothetical protein